MTSRRGAVAGLLVVAAVIAVLVGTVALSGDATPAPAGAVAAVQDDHLPVDPIEAIPARLDLIAGTGVTTTRVDLYWMEMAPRRPESPRDPSDPAYDFRRADLILAGLARRGITPIVSVYNAPAWATGGTTAPGIPQNTLTPEPEDFGDVMAAVAARYSGTFTPAAAAAPLPAVRHLELWNEPNLKGFLTPQFIDGDAVSLDAYAAMVREAYGAIKAVNPAAVVIAGVGGPRSSTTDTGVGAIDWVRGLVERRIPLDAYSQHVYPAAAPREPTQVVPSWATLGRFIDEIDAFGPDLPLYITEAGYTTAATEARDVPGVSEVEQARYLRQIYALPQLRSERIAAVVWFNLQDNRGWPAGLMRDDEGRTRKPSHQAFREVVERQGGAHLP